MWQCTPPPSTSPTAETPAHPPSSQPGSRPHSRPASQSPTPPSALTGTKKRSSKPAHMRRNIRYRRHGVNSGLSHSSDRGNLQKPISIMSYLSYDQLCHKRQNPFCNLGTNWMLNWRLSDANTHIKETHFSIHFLLVIQRGWAHPASCNIPLFSAVFSFSCKKQLWKQMFRYQTGSGIAYFRLTPFKTRFLKMSLEFLLAKQQPVNLEIKAIAAQSLE